LQYFFSRLVNPVLLGVLAKMGGRTWFFAGEFVVDWWLKRGSYRHVFDLEKFVTFLKFIFGWTN
jgi:hypothetical protein